MNNKTYWTVDRYCVVTETTAIVRGDMTVTMFERGNGLGWHVEVRTPTAVFIGKVATKAGEGRITTIEVYTIDKTGLQMFQRYTDKDNAFDMRLYDLLGSALEEVRYHRRDCRERYGNDHNLR